MAEFIEKYINPFMGFGFKKLFGEELNKDLLLDFLNELLREEQGQIKDLTYLKTEHLGLTESDRKAIFDLYCENERGEKFIVELQKSKQNFFKDRTVYYSTFPIREQAKRADWNFELKAVYTIAILDFVFDSDKNEPEKFRYDVKLQDIETNKIFYDKLTFIYLEMPKFKKSIDELATRFEKWLYLIRNLNQLERIPESLRERIFEKVFETAEIAKFTPEQVLSYEDSLKYYRDLKNSLDTAREKGEAEGIQKVARNMLSLGLSMETISQATGLSEEEINHLR
ncbi:Rpn family recombination-promoting nuclease/putative transposase [Arcicella rosea]|uniref:Putative transposase/invertase (TIGR01784 family) n=1 Tax=Arcicella rosea TaxID=502909 RepID=A0A841ENU1_9BACT|nr:Rpn family recombination-promoting nuclease/putative transposase [Arcicella rosea]MBB6003049.1 putative transposase/invertase (TIGR01784 family) [Arcicella rosea]